jgi:hypothetical protein
MDASSVARQPVLRELHCRIVVSDTGCGMDSSRLTRASSPSSARAAGQGSGLGGAVAHGIQSDGGAIERPQHTGSQSVRVLHQKLSQLRRSCQPQAPQVLRARCARTLSWYVACKLI